MAVPRPYLPDLVLPLQAPTRHGEVVRIRHLIPGEPRVDSASEYDDWGIFDLEFEDSAHGRAIVEVRNGADQAAPWTPVGDMSWHAELHGPNLG